MIVDRFFEELDNDFKILEKHPIDIISKTGLSANQTKVYLCLSKSGEKSVSQISKILSIPRTEIYTILKTLQQKDCVKIKNGRPCKFLAIPIEKYFEKKLELEYRKIQELEKFLRIVRNLKFYQTSDIKYQLFN